MARPWSTLAVLLAVAVAVAVAVVAAAPSSDEGSGSSAPWDGIVGFLRTIARIRDRQPEPEASEESDGQPLRKIVYAVEEQVSETATGTQSNASVVIFDSQQSEDAGPGTRGKRDLSSVAPQVEEQRAAAVRPYFIGRKLWYVPLWFGLYLILYILALTVKSVARHRIKYPTLVSEGDFLSKRRNGVTRRVTNALSNAEQRFQQRWTM